MSGEAPGRPGIPARWTSSAKSAFGTALTLQSHVWYTISHGILNEIYYPRVDYACTRDFGFIVTNGRDYFSEEKRHARSTVHPVEDGVPAFRLANVSADGRYRIDKTVLADPTRDVVLQRISFRALDGARDYRLFALLAPHLVNRGANNHAWLGTHKGREMLFAAGSGSAMALACSALWRARSVGFVGSSDGWQDLHQHFELTWNYDSARGGNVALTAEIDLADCDGEFIVALGFGRRAEEAAHRVISSLNDGFDAALAGFTDSWQDWQARLLPLDPPHDPGAANTYRISTAVLRTHESNSFPGRHDRQPLDPVGLCSGDERSRRLSPRLAARSGRDGGRAACLRGFRGCAPRARTISKATQEADGHWPQNCWLDGEPYWSGMQMDECAFPILLVDLLWRESGADIGRAAPLWPMVKRAAAFVMRNGPVTGQDRWEEDAGYSPFTLAVEIAALLAAADIADRAGEADAGCLFARHRRCVERADRALDLRDRHGAGARGRRRGLLRAHRAAERAERARRAVVSCRSRIARPIDSGEPAASWSAPTRWRWCASACAQRTIRASCNTVRVIDALLKVRACRTDRCWHRYNGDGYGEHEDGSAVRRHRHRPAWPLLTGERAHYELAAGRHDEAERAARDDGGVRQRRSAASRNRSGTATDIPERELFAASPSGSAMPLVWAHAEHIKLLRSLREERVFDMPPQPVSAIRSKGYARRSASGGSTRNAAPSRPARFCGSSCRGRR